jgi:hypothetical protein
MAPRASRLAAEDFLPQSLPQVGSPADATLAQKVLQIVKGSGDGASTADIAQAVRVSGPTALKVLKELEREREVYSRSHTKRPILIWYPNGRLIHPYLEVYRELRGKTYRASIQEGRSGPTVQLQERSFSLLSGERVEGAIFVDLTSLEEFIETLNELKRKYETFDPKSPEAMNELV